MNSLCVRRRVMLAAVGVVLVTAGCQHRGTVEGKVSHQAKPVVWGTVSIIGSDAMLYTGAIGLDGSYSVANVPNGPVKILVSSPDPYPARRKTNMVGSDLSEAPSESSGPPKPPPGAWFPIPAEYADLDKTSLKGTVSSDTIIDLELP